MLERVLRAQSKRAAQDVALSRRKQGSSPLGSANQINGLYRIGQLLLFPSPIFLQINSGTRGTGLLRVLVPPISYESEGRGREFESRRARQ